MNSTHRWHRSLIWCCLWSCLVPARLPAADVPPTVVVRDVALTSAGELHGVLVTKEGRPRAAAQVNLCQGTGICASGTTDAKGGFVLRGVKPGVYQLATGEAAALYRVWTAPTAPPAAKPNALLVEGQSVTRGQLDWSPGRRALILSGIIITSGVIGGVIGYNIKDDDSAS